MTPTDLMTKQIGQLKECHFHILCWVAQAENKKIKYNITNVFDDLKHWQITRTKQSAMTYIESLSLLCFIAILLEQNRRNLYITKEGAKALEILIKQRSFTTKSSLFLEG